MLLSAHCSDICQLRIADTPLCISFWSVPGENEVRVSKS